MDPHKTHYQLSFTVRQALALFVGLLLALSVAYFFGVMTGLPGREPDGAKTAAPSAAGWPAGASENTPAEPPGTSGAAEARAAEPTAPAQIQLFQDRAGEEVTPAPVARAATPARGPGAPFYVQVLSVRSEREARVRSRRLSSRGYHASVERVPGPKGSLYRVRVGPYRTREEAARVAQRLSRQEKVKAWIVPAGK